MLRVTAIAPLLSYVSRWELPIHLSNSPGTRNDHTEVTVKLSPL
jgi:hypothetical protein